MGQGNPSQHMDCTYISSQKNIIYESRGWLECLCFYVEKHSGSHTYSSGWAPGSIGAFYEISENCDLFILK